MLIDLDSPSLHSAIQAFNLTTVSIIDVRPITYPERTTVRLHQPWAYLLNAAVSLYICCMQQEDLASAFRDLFGRFAYYPSRQVYSWQISRSLQAILHTLSPPYHNKVVIPWSFKCGLPIFRRLMSVWSSGGSQMSTTSSSESRNTPWILKTQACMTCQPTQT